MDPMARRSPKRNLLPVLRICNEGGRAIKQNHMDQSGLSVLTHLLHHSKHLCIKVFLSTRIFIDLRNTGVPNGLSLFALASAAIRSQRKKKKKTRPEEACFFKVNARKVQTLFNKNVLARTIKGQEQRFRRLLHILCIPNSKIAS
jgi:hypothetical protein